jgi:uncharacterized protein YdeI (YjbR/CyaY-like superfamily)
MKGTNPKTDFFFNKEGQWHDEYAELRKIILDCDLAEELKWGCPCYTHNDKNVVLIHGFKEYCAILFMKGALMQNAENILIQQTENVQSARQMRFTGKAEIMKLKATIKAYVLEAKQIAGLKVELKKTTEYAVPEEFQRQLDKDTNLKKAFHALTPGRQRGYLFYFSQPKTSKTREARVEKAIPQILDGKGLDD